MSTFAWLGLSNIWKEMRFQGGNMNAADSKSSKRARPIKIASTDGVQGLRSSQSLVHCIVIDLPPGYCEAEREDYGLQTQI